MTNFHLLALGGQEWLWIILAILLLFGGRKIPELMRGLGKGIREFNDAKDNVKREIEDNANTMNRDPKKSADATAN